MSELVERYKELSSQLAVLDADVERVKAEREGVCKQLLAQFGKGHEYDLGDGLPRVITTTKIGTHYMAPKNKWQKAGKPPKPPKTPRPARATKPEKEASAKPPLVKRQIVGGKIVEVPVERRPSSIPPAPAVTLPDPQVGGAVTIKNEGVVPVVVEAPKVTISLEPASAQSTVAVATGVAEPVVVQKQPESVATVEKPKPLDPLEAALAELDASDLE